MIARGISEKEVAEALKRGSKSLQRPDKVLSYYRYFCVVSKKVGEDTYRISKGSTLYLDASVPHQFTNANRHVAKVISVTNPVVL